MLKKIAVLALAVSTLALPFVFSYLGFGSYYSVGLGFIVLVGLALVSTLYDQPTEKIPGYDVSPSGSFESGKRQKSDPDMYREAKPFMPVDSHEFDLSNRAKPSSTFGWLGVLCVLGAVLFGLCSIFEAISGNPETPLELLMLSGALLCLGLLFFFLNSLRTKYKVRKLEERLSKRREAPLKSLPPE